MMKRIFKFIAFYLLIILKSFLIVFVFINIFKFLNHKMYTEGVDRGESFRNIPEKSIDIIFLGSSHTQYSTIPSLIYRSSGFSSYNLGSSCQPLEISVEFLKESLKRQKPKLVALEIYRVFESVCEGDNAIVTGQYKLTGQEKQRVLNMLSEEKALEYRQEFLNNHNNWKDYQDFNRFFKFRNGNKIEEDVIDYNFGFLELIYIEYDNYWPLEDDIEPVETYIDQQRIDSIKEIYDICKENGIELMLYFVPLSYSPEQAYIKEKVWEFARENNIKYLDFMDNVNGNDFFVQVHGDVHHNFITGANIVSQKLASFILDNYDFEPYNNEEISKIYLNNSNTMLNYILSLELNPKLIFNRLKEFENVMILKYVGEANNLSEEDNQLIKDLGFNNNFVKNPHTDYFAILKDNKVLIESDEYIKYEFDGKTIEISKDGILVDGKDMNYSTTHFNGSDVVNTSNLTLVVYDKNYKWEVIKNFEVKKPFWVKGFDHYVPEGYWQ